MAYLKDLALELFDDLRLETARDDAVEAEQSQDGA